MFSETVIVGFFIFFSVIFPPHPIHVALTTVEYKDTEEQFTVTFKIFYDDLEKIIAENYGVALKIGKPDENPQAGVWFQRYLDEHFLLKLNDTAELAPQYISRKINEQAIWLYCRIPYKGKIKTVSLTNTVMMDMYPDQTDLVIFKYGDLEKGIRFHRKYFRETITVNEKL